ncbi:hypothetical protein [Flagellimonas sp.]|uniref:hypothetical protein n=1 Tax=Flagellimonas sp. TaxID=2058762 RepID=UPI003B5C0DEA
MKRVVKLMSFILIISAVFMACSKDDDDIPGNTSKLSSIKYGTSKLEAKPKVAIISKSATISPKGAAVSFKISKVTKDKKDFTNPKIGGFKIDSKGVVTATKDHKLEAGTYELTITAVAKKNKKNTKTAMLTIVVSKSETSKSRLNSLTYSPNKLDGKQKVEFTSKDAVLSPKSASVTFKFIGIYKEKKKFKNPKNGGFKIDSKGRIFASKNHNLSAGTYRIKVSATDKNDKKNKKEAKYTVVIK